MRQQLLDFDPATSTLGHEIADAAGELACRLELGEFDDLDDMQLADLRTLATQMAAWARHAQALEQRLAFGHDGAVPALQNFAICN